jgi:hypothetical protein
MKRVANNSDLANQSLRNLVFMLLANRGLSTIDSKECRTKWGLQRDNS